MNNIFTKTWNVATRFFDSLYTYTYWFFRDVRYGLLNRDKEDLENRLLVAGHIIEKGITMPERRLGFGQGVIRMVISFCNNYITNYGIQSEQLQFAIDNLDEYLKLHCDYKYALPKDIVESIEKLLAVKYVAAVECKSYAKDEFFKPTTNFFEFANSRHTSRWYSGKPVPKDVISHAVELAKTAPSACNRQSIKVVCTSGVTKDAVIDLQNGNRGFGERIGQMLIITSNQKAWDYNWRTSAYLDGGIFIMNLLYALHFYGVASCTLNAHLSISNQKKLRRITNISDSELIIAFIAIGMPADEMMIAKSRRLSTEEILRFV